VLLDDRPSASQKGAQVFDLFANLRASPGAFCLEEGAVVHGEAAQAKEIARVQGTAGAVDARELALGQSDQIPSEGGRICIAEALGQALGQLKGGGGIEREVQVSDDPLVEIGRNVQGAWA
jgi:hypothetical protein